MNRFLIIADDFTGANDTGVQFTKRGIATQVIFSCEVNEYSGEALVIDTESRGLDGKDAYQRVKDFSKAVLEKNFTCVYKKVDSTLRGNIAEEIRGLDEIFKPELIIFAPAYPDSGRTTINGVQHMKGIPVSQTEIGKDPKKPVTEDYIAKLLESGLNEEVNHISLGDIRSGNIDFSRGRVFASDAEKNEDLIKTVEQVMKQNKKILWIGSAGLANAIMEFNIPARPVLSIVGSISEVSSKQLHFAEAHGSKVIKVDISNMLNGQDTAPVIEEAVRMLIEGQDTILCSSYTREEYEASIQSGSKLNMTKEQISIFAQETLGKIAAEILKKAEVAGMFLTGGDTAIEVIRKIQANGTNIIQELTTGIPLMSLQGGLFHGLHVVTKAGAFGETNALQYCIQKLKEHGKKQGGY
jgi:D-threonate/D-erythronate kinase